MFSGIEELLSSPKCSTTKQLCSSTVAQDHFGSSQAQQEEQKKTKEHKRFSFRKLTQRSSAGGPRMKEVPSAARKVSE